MSLFIISKGNSFINNFYINKSVFVFVIISVFISVFTSVYLFVFKARSGKPLKNKLIHSIDGKYCKGRENKNRYIFRAATFQDSSQRHC